MSLVKFTSEERDEMRGALSRVRTAIDNNAKPEARELVNDLQQELKTLPKLEKEITTTGDDKGDVPPPPDFDEVNEEVLEDMESDTNPATQEGGMPEERAEDKGKEPSEDSGKEPSEDSGQSGQDSSASEGDSKVSFN